MDKAEKIEEEQADALRQIEERMAMAKIYFDSEDRIIKKLTNKTEPVVEKPMDKPATNSETRPEATKTPPKKTKVEKSVHTELQARGLKPTTLPNTQVFAYGQLNDAEKLKAIKKYDELLVTEAKERARVEYNRQIARASEPMGLWLRLKRRWTLPKLVTETINQLKKDSPTKNRLLNLSAVLVREKRSKN